MLTKEEGSFQEAERMDASDKKLELLLYLDRLQDNSPLLPREKRAWERVLLLIRGRGWPSETIRAFFLEEEDIDEINHLLPGNIPQLKPSVAGPTAIVVPRVYGQGLSETALTTILLRAMIHARSAALPERPENSPQKDGGLLSLGEGIVEIIAENILPSPPEVQFENIMLSRRSAEILCQRAGVSSDELERLSIGEALRALADKLHCSLPNLPKQI